MSKRGLINIARRDALKGLLLASFVSLTSSGASGLALGQSVNGDLSILRAALYLEDEAIAAYQAGAESGLLSEEILKVAVAFQSDHKFHREGIISGIKTLTGAPPEINTAKFHFGRLKTATDVLKLAHKLEQGAVAAYSTLAANIENRDVLDYAANVLVDEVRHFTVLTAVLKPA